MPPPSTRPATSTRMSYIARPRWPLVIYRVAGDSMLPTYRSGDTLLGWRWFRPRPGQVVVAMHDGLPLIKRLARIEPDSPSGPGALWLLGDNPAASTDSRQFGALGRADLVARIVARLDAP
jgi:phage repressor protein C with HTH and peptisase S24 domain